MFNDTPQKQSKNHVDGTSTSTTDDTESNNTPTTQEANVKDSLKSARNKRFYLGGTAVALVAVVVVIVMTVVLLGDDIRGSDKIDALASSSNSDNADNTGSVVSVPNTSMVQDDRAIRITNFINSIKLSTATLALPVSFYTPLTGSKASSISAEQAALSWLVYNDPLQLWPDSKANQLRLQQRYALLTLLLQMKDFEATLSNSTDECDWSLLVENCTESTEPATLGIDVVTVLSIWYQFDVSTVPGSTLPLDLGLLNHLVSFRVENMGLTARLPSSLGTKWTNLAMFSVSNNSLTGSLPPSLGTAWTNLEVFGVSDNTLTGSLPSLLGTAWTNLADFGVSDNALTGSLPSVLGTTWTNLKEFSVSSNDLTGSLPSSLGTAWTNLADFRVTANALTGSLPSLLGTTWTNLATFSVSINALTGTIPNNLAGNWNELQEAYFHNNGLVGSMPSEFCPDVTATMYDLWADCNEKVVCSCCTDCF